MAPKGFVISFVIFAAVREINAGIIGAFVLPHGGIALDPNYFTNESNATTLQEAWELHDACVQVGEEIRQLSPDLIVLSTPHGIADLNDFQFYLNQRASGRGDTDNCECPPCCYSISVKLAPDVAQDLIDFLKSNGLNNVSGLSAHAPPLGSLSLFPLAWGEVIPLHFVQPNTTPIVVLSQPSRRYYNSVIMIPELLKLGGSLAEQLEAMGQRIVIVISADLAHKHLSSGPFGYSNQSDAFDKACGIWAETLSANALLETAAAVVDEVYSCGYTGLVTLHGTLSKVGLAEWMPQLLANRHPSYYGMMIASFIRKSIKK